MNKDNNAKVVTTKHFNIPGQKETFVDEENTDATININVASTSPTTKEDLTATLALSTDQLQRNTETTNGDIATTVNEDGLATASAPTSKKIIQIQIDTTTLCDCIVPVPSQSEGSHMATFTNDRETLGHSVFSSNDL